MSARLAALVALASTVALAPAAGAGGIADTVHNLSVSGPGSIRAPGAGDMCAFCHTPHRAVQTRALWNRELPPVTYRLYQSTTLKVTLKQPTGASRLCLSCHDGMTALGAVRVPSRAGRVTLGPLTGSASLGTDLSDDHPVSFVYDPDLAARRAELAVPLGLLRDVRLDGTGQVQCTTCHDSHEARHRKFLKVDDTGGALCTSCHRLRHWADSAHATSTATWSGAATNPWPATPYTTVAENGCENCHRPHAAPHPERLLSDTQEAGVCLACHGGSVARKNLEPGFLKPSAHPVLGSSGAHDPREDPSTMPRHVTCVDCHNPHQAAGAPVSGPGLPGTLRGVSGLAMSGGRLASVRQEAEVCLKCHGVRDETTPGIVRNDNTRNVRLQISPGNPSYHPVVATGRNAMVTGFEAGYSASSTISCIDCHNDDQAASSGSAPRGPHGSTYAPLLERNYEVNDPAVEAYQTYAACYKCHNRQFLLGDQARTFPHQRHVVDDQAPCAVCHDAHGSRRNPGLVNFMLRDRSGRTVVGPSQTLKRLELVSLGPGSGQCYLTCHGKNHEPLAYP